MTLPVTTAIFASYVLAEVEGATLVLRDHWVLTEAGRIAAVLSSRPEADLVLDKPGRFILPGLLNLHNHCCAEAFSRTRSEDLAMGSSDDLLRVLGPVASRGSEALKVVGAEQRLAIARLGILQLLKGGTATVMEPFRGWLPEMFEAAADMGIRFYGAPYLFSRDTVGGQSGGRETHASDLAGWDRLHARWHGAAGGRLRVAMSPHGTDTCDADLLRAAAARARSLNVPITLHLAQSGEEVATIARTGGGRTPVEYLEWLGVLGPDLLAAHCILASDADLRLMAGIGATVLNCPRTYARAGVTAAYSRFRKHGVRTLVATDGYNMDLLSELNAASLISKCTEGRADVATSRDLIGAVTREAADALARPDLGRIAPGATADLTAVSLRSPLLQPVHDPLKAVVALASRADVDIVMVDGRLLVEEGRYLLGDEDAITAAGTAAVDAIRSRPEVRGAFAD